jgi:hypothetical protein
MHKVSGLRKNIALIELAEEAIIIPLERVGLDARIAR